MNNIITNAISNETLTSMEVAEMVNKEHKNLIRDIRRYINQLGEAKIGLSCELKIEPADFFIESTYIDAQGKERPCFNVTRKGCEFIAHKMTSQKGTEFTARYVNKFHELEEGNITNSLVNALNTISESMIRMETDINNRLSKLEESHSSTSSTPQIEQTYKKPYNPWFAKMQPKYKLLEDYFNITRGQLYKNILMELENLYELDTHQIQADYCYENNILSCYPLEPYEFNPKFRDMIETIVNSNLVKYGIVAEDNPIVSTKHITIFNEPVKANGEKLKEQKYIVKEI